MPASGCRRCSGARRSTWIENGLITLFVAIGLATWTAPAGSPPNAPVILVPARISPDGAEHWDFSLELSGDAQVNPALAHVFRTDYGVETTGEDNGWDGDLPGSPDEINRNAVLN